MELAKRDISIQHLQNLIKQKHKNITDKNKTLPQQSKDNVYLREIMGDYNIYFDNINQEKTNQYNALQLLAEYITQIILDPTSTEEMLRQCKYDQSLILSEMKQINK
uniref:Uncharacterized protein n=1 Tax=viral metagenome TaxID=1070528 RepID=A0A6C0ILK5_9ZZZZ